MKTETQQIIDIVNEHPLTCSKIIKANSKLYQYIQSTYNFPQLKHKNLSEILYWIVNNISDFPKCPTCGKSLEGKYFSITRGYQTHCCNKCAQLDKKIQQKIKDTTKLRYGSETYRNIKKSKITCLKKYGVENSAQSDVVKQHTKRNNIAKYGKEYFFQSEAFKIKSKTTLLKHYNVDNPFKSEIIKQKIAQTNINKYGQKNPSMVHDIQTKKYSKYTYNNIQFDSSPELAYYIWLKDNNIKFEYQPKEYSIKYIDENNKERIYFPDFLLIDTNQLVELKGDQFFDKNNNPISQLNKQSWKIKYDIIIKHNILLLRSKDYAIYLNYINTKYGKTYLQNFRNVNKKYENAKVNN